MREIYQNILNVVIIIFIIGSSILFYSQQKAINQLKNPNSVATSGKVDISQIDQDQKNSEASVKFIAGRLVSISGNTLTVEADMPDWKKMKEPRTGSNTPLTYKKTYTVTTDGKTQFLANKLDSLKAGDTIGVASKELVYQTDKLTAVFVISPNALPGS